MSNGGTGPVDDFLQGWDREIDFYATLAQRVARKCEALIAGRAIKGFVTFRAKTYDSLGGKLRKRDAEKAYTSEADIREDIADLAGVRIALYFPNDRTTVLQLLSSSFDVVHIRELPEPKKETTNRFPGYDATHYRAKVLPKDLPTEESRFAGVSCCRSGGHAV